MECTTRCGWRLLLVGSVLSCLLCPLRVCAQQVSAEAVSAPAPELPVYQRDRGLGIPMSMFGAYIERGELVIFPFVAFSFDHDREYQPVALGYGLDQDFRGHYYDLSEQLLVAYGITDWLELELEGSLLYASLARAPGDASGMPRRIEEAGLADLDGQLRVRPLHEGVYHPEVFAFFEVTAPAQTRKVLIGEPAWDLRFGLGVIKGFTWGTLTFRTDVEYNRDDEAWDLGETSLEYLKRFSRAFALYVAIEGGETGALDEWTLDVGVYWRVTDYATLRFDNSIGFLSKSTDWAPQLGIMFSPLPSATARTGS